MFWYAPHLKNDVRMFGCPGGFYESSGGFYESSGDSMVLLLLFFRDGLEVNIVVVYLCIGL